MRKNAALVIDAFKHGKYCNGSTITTDGVKVWSYQMPIAKMENGFVVLVKRESAPSKTTRSHIDALALAFPDATRVESI